MFKVQWSNLLDTQIYWGLVLDGMGYDFIDNPNFLVHFGFGGLKFFWLKIWTQAFILIKVAYSFIGDSFKNCSLLNSHLKCYLDGHIWTYSLSLKAILIRIQKIFWTVFIPKINWIFHLAGFDLPVVLEDIPWKYWNIRFIVAQSRPRLSTVKVSNPYSIRVLESTKCVRSRSWIEITFINWYQPHYPTQITIMPSY